MKTWKSLVSSDDAQNSNLVRASEVDQLPVDDADLNFKRMTRGRLEEEAHLGEDAGSLWTMEGQGSYLFSQNRSRTLGDQLVVKLEGNAKSQLTTKAQAISKLIDKIDRVREPAQAAKPEAPKSETGAAAPAAPGANATTEPAAPNSPFQVESVATRIVEQNKDGSYRVRGMQPFMIGKREYKVVVSGLVRPENFNDSGINSSELIDAQYDIISGRRSTK